MYRMKSWTKLLVSHQKKAFWIIFLFLIINMDVYEDLYSAFPFMPREEEGCMAAA